MTLTFDVSLKNQEQRNLIPAAISAMLYEDNVTHGGIRRLDEGLFEVITPSRTIEYSDEQLDAKLASQAAERAAIEAQDRIDHPEDYDDI